MNRANRLNGEESTLPWLKSAAGTMLRLHLFNIFAAPDCLETPFSLGKCRVPQPNVATGGHGCPPDTPPQRGTRQGAKRSSPLPALWVRCSRAAHPSHQTTKPTSGASSTTQFRVDLQLETETPNAYQKETQPSSHYLRGQLRGHYHPAACPSTAP